jgi:hypothetical protein
MATQQQSGGQPSDETKRLPQGIPPELTSEQPDATTKISQYPDGRILVHSVRNGVEGHLEFHSDGSYKYTSNSGTTVNFHSNNSVHYSKGGHTLTLDNNGDVKLMGHNRVNFDHDSHGETAKNNSGVTNGMTEMHFTRHLKITAADVYIGSTKGSVVMNAARDMEMTATKGRMTQHSSGVHTVTTDKGDFHVATGGQGEVDINSGGNSSITSKGSVNTTGAQGTNIADTSNITVNAKGNIENKAGGTNTMSADGGNVLKSSSGTNIEKVAMYPPTGGDPANG